MNGRPETIARRVRRACSSRSADWYGLFPDSRCC